MFDGDECAALILGLFEESTNGEMQRRKSAEEPGDPWFAASIAGISELLLGLYGERSIRSAIDRLVSLGVVEEQYPPGRCKWYLLNVSYVNDLLRSGTVLSKDQDPAGTFGH